MISTYDNFEIEDLGIVEDWVYDIFFNIKHIGNKNRRLFNEKRTNRVPINQFFRN